MVILGKKNSSNEEFLNDGASGRIRTSDRSVRSRVLYPAELRMQIHSILNQYILNNLSELN